MNLWKFRRRVEAFIPQNAEEGLADTITRHSIGVVTLGEETIPIRIAVTRVQGTPLGKGREGEGSRIRWRVVTANTDPADNSIYFQETPEDEVIGTDVVKLKAGESPWLPDDALVVASRVREFYPGLYYPATQERHQIQFLPGVQHDI